MQVSSSKLAIKKGLAPNRKLSLSLYGAGTRSRTPDLLITSQLLYRLSYTGMMGRILTDYLAKATGE